MKLLGLDVGAGVWRVKEPERYGESSLLHSNCGHANTSVAKLLVNK